jgi:hypothetical protein
MENPNPEPAPKKLQKKEWFESQRDLDRLYEAVKEAVKRQGMAVPGELAKEMGWARSSLATNLRRLQKKRKIMKVGGGRSTRYRLMTADECFAINRGEIVLFQKKSPKAASKAPSSNALPRPSNAPAANPTETLILGLKDLFKRFLKGEDRE